MRYSGRTGWTKEQTPGSTTTNTDFGAFYPCDAFFHTRARTTSCASFSSCTATTSSAIGASASIEYAFSRGACGSRCTSSPGTNNFMAAAGGGANRPPTGGPVAARPWAYLTQQIKDFQPATPTRANTKPIYGAEIKPIDEPARFDNFQYPYNR